MNGHYELITNGQLTLMQMHKNLTQVASFLLKLIKTPSFGDSIVNWGDLF